VVSSETQGKLLGFEFQEVYAVFSTDEDGRIRKESTCHGYYSDEETADVVSLGKNAYGGKGAVIRKVVIQLRFEKGYTAYLVESREPVGVNDQKAEKLQEIREKAASKLEPEERKALGLDG